MVSLFDLRSVTNHYNIEVQQVTGLTLVRHTIPEKSLEL